MLGTGFSPCFIYKKTKSNVGKFLDVKSESGSFRMITGDSIQSSELLRKEKFDLIISDIPYGIQHLASKKSKNPYATIEDSFSEWKKCLSTQGSIVIGFNSNNPKRSKLLELAEAFELVEFPFKSEHRMSESIVRDVLILKNHS